MNKAFLKKTVSAVAVAAMIITLSPLGVSAHWRQNIDSTWSYTDGNKIAQGWKDISNIWYYFDSNGKMNKGWICDNGKWYYNNNSGAMEKGWINVDGIWYYLDDTGAMQTGIIKINGKTYCFNNLGEMLVGTVKLGNKLFSFNSNGQAMRINETNSVDASMLTNTNSNQDSSGTGTTIATSTTIDVNGLLSLPQNYVISVQATAENKIVELMNQKRIEAGLQPLIMDNTLLQVARYKSNHMIQYNYFDHTTPEGTKWTDWLKVIGYKYTATGENIAYNTYDAVQLFNQWWNSPGHRANMMNASYTKVGVGILNGNGKYMGTQEFSN